MSRFGTLGTQYFDDAGDPLIDGLIYFYASGTTTKITTYADINLTIPNTNPVKLTGAGRQPNIFFDGSAKAILAHSNYEQVEVRDPIGEDSAAGTDPWIATIGYAKYDEALATDGYNYVSILPNNTGNDPISSPLYWTKLLPVKVWNINETYAADDLVSATDGMVYVGLVAANTGNNPATNDMTKWRPINLTTNAGDVVFSGDLLRYTSPSWLECNGNTYNSTTYAVLYAKIGGKYVKLANPSTLPTNVSYGISININSSIVAVSTISSPFIQWYTLASDLLTKVTNPAALPTGQGRGCAFSDNGLYSVLAHDITPFITHYDISAGPAFTKTTNPTTLPTGTGVGCAYSHASDFLAVAHSVSPYLSVYQITTGPTTLTKIANPSTLPAGNGAGVCWNSDGSIIFVAHTTTPFVSGYSLAGTALTKLSNPVDLPGGNGTCVAISPDDAYVAVGHAITPFVTIYSNVAGVLTKIADPVDLPVAAATGASFNSSSDRLTVSIGSTPFQITYSIINGEFSKLTAIDDIPSSSQSVHYSPGGNYVAFSTGTPYMIVSKLSPILPDIDLAASPDVKAYINTGL